MIEDPDVFQKAVNHVWYIMEVMLGETRNRMEWIAQQQHHNPEFDGYGDLESRVHVLKAKLRLFRARYEALEI